MNWAQIDIYTSSDGIDAVTGSLMMLGINGFVIKDSKDFEDFLNDKSANWDYIDDDLMGLKNAETTVTIYLSEDAGGAELLRSVKNELDRLKACDNENRFGRLTLEIKSVRDEDWANNWKKYFKPIEISDRLIIKPSWENVSSDGRTVLELDPENSFGTGQHETTRLCLELLADCPLQGKRVLDLGCGSGILSIAASLLGASSATAVDIDENSVKTAESNAYKNGISPERYRLLCGDITTNEQLRCEIGGGFDLICANIVADVLISMSGYFSGFLSADGTLLVSGIIDERLDEVRQALERQGFEAIAQKSDGGWNSLKLNRQM
ncbi:MAG: 50S ribosomal protein L11 methyltransferase [Ruminococcus sp.]|nr:50S ribosomal protein L11 methyltransferase [Ruminococcus sp.]